MYDCFQVYSLFTDWLQDTISYVNHRNIYPKLWDGSIVMAMINLSMGALSWKRTQYKNLSLMESGPIPAIELHNSSIKSFKFQTLTIYMFYNFR